MKNIPISGVGHREGSRSSSVLSRNNLVTTELYTLDQSGQLVGWDLDRWLGLAEQRDDCLSGVATDNWNSQALRVFFANNLSNEGLSSDNIESGNTEETLGVKDSLGLENLGCDWDGGVDGVGDDEEVGLGAVPME